MSEPSEEVNRLRELNRALSEATGVRGLRIEIVTTETGARCIATDAGGDEGREVVAAAAVMAALAGHGILALSQSSRFERS